LFDKSQPTDPDLLKEMRGRGVGELLSPTVLNAELRIYATGLEKPVMIMKHAKLALVSLLVLAAAPGAMAVAEAPNAINNANVDRSCDSPIAGSGTTGPYDSFDSFKDSTGRPCSGWEYLFYSPNN
jgi:hypothetical protein